MTRNEMAKMIVKPDRALGLSSSQLRELHCNGYKTACTSAVLGFFGIEKKSFRYCQTVQDVLNIFRRNGFSLKKHKIKRINDLAPGFYLVYVEGHVAAAYMSDKKELNFPVDTCPSETQNKNLLGIWKIKISKRK